MNNTPELHPAPPPTGTARNIINGILLWPHEAVKWMITHGIFGSYVSGYEIVRKEADTP